VDNSANVEDRESVPIDDIKVDNPRAKVVIPATGESVERGGLLTVQAVPVSPNGDPARNGHDVGQIAFLTRRKAAPDGGVDGPWIIVDAKDSNLNGEFGEFGDEIDPSDTNEPYMVHWRVPEWLIIDDPATEAVREETAEYWIVAVAGDSNTGPLDHGLPLDPGANGADDDEDGFVDEADEGLIHWDNPYHIIDCAERAALVTVVDEHPPKTRVLQVGNYAVPSELKIVVGQTVTVFAGDTEVDWMPPAMFPTPVRWHQLRQRPSRTWLDGRCQYVARSFLRGCGVDYRYAVSAGDTVTVRL
jgi:hypothetical protein